MIYKSMRHLRLYENFNQGETFYYHFSKRDLKPGDLIRSSICEDPVYLHTILPIYQEVAESHGFNWPIVHGYCFDSPNWIFTSGPDKTQEEALKNYQCYRVIAEDDVHEGAIDRSAQLATMLFRAGSITENEVSRYARQYFMRPPTTYKESICSSFRVVERMNPEDWGIKQSEPI